MNSKYLGGKTNNVVHLPLSPKEPRRPEIETDQELIYVYDNYHNVVPFYFQKTKQANPLKAQALNSIFPAKEGSKLILENNVIINERAKRPQISKYLSPKKV